MPNRLASESSPYLLQHKDNPVDWYPWTAEALLKARSEDKPIFLSIGYSACHWCHVMEHESFENERIADFLNEHFISIKVDREERPDLDQIYMQAVMAIQGHGGWPLSAFLTPDQDFFFGGTYWPPMTTAQMPGFDRILAGVLDAFHNRRDEVVTQSKQITEMINQSATTDEHSEIDDAFLEAAAQTMSNRFDSTYGGFGTAPKFPHPMDLKLLLRLCQNQRTIDSEQKPASKFESPSADEMLEIVEVTLRRMAYGGIFDHLAGGFSRYSVDARWLVPHFEKMLYDNSLLAGTYLRAFQSTGHRFYSRVCEKTLDYLLIDMTDDEGGFYSTEDADSEGVEGKFYVWQVDEVIGLLGKETGQRFCQLYDVTVSGNFEGTNILNLPISFEKFAEEKEIDKRTLMTEMREARQKLLPVRNQRIRPGLDDKVLVSWNGMAITAFADAAVVLRNETYANAATKAGEFIWNKLRDEQGRLLHTWRNGVARLSAYLDDYASLIDSYLSLYRVAFDDRWLLRATELHQQMVDHYFDESTGAFFYTANDHEHLIARTREFQDTAVPSGNSMAAMSSLRLGRLLGNQSMIDLAHRTMVAATPLLKRAVSAASQSLIAIDSWLHERKSFVLAIHPGNLSNDEQANNRIVNKLRSNVPLEQSLLVVRTNDNETISPLATTLSESLLAMKPIDGQPTLYICQDFQCQAPLTGAAEIEKFLSCKM